MEMAVEQEKTASRGKTIISLPLTNLKILGKLQDNLGLIFNHCRYILKQRRSF